MKSLVINLARRADRLQHFNKVNAEKLSDMERIEAIDGRELTIESIRQAGFDTNQNWHDPVRGTKLTRGEVGCFMSHHSAWTRCVEIGEPVIVFEDDALLSDRFNENQVQELTGRFDLLYLARQEMSPDSVIQLDDDLEIPHYPYWCSAYAITPEAAAKLLNGGGQTSIIPADEYVPRMIQEIGQVAAFRDNVVSTRSKSDGITDIDPCSEDDYFIDFPVHVITIGTEPEKCERLTRSAEHYGIQVTNLGLGVDWRGTDMTGPGGGHKLNLIRDYVSNLEDNEVVLFLDGYDTFFAGDLDTIVRRYFGFGNRVLFAAEKILWPDKMVIHPLSHTPYRFLNSGLFIGEAGTIRAMLQEPIPNDADDQLYLQRKFLSGRYDIGLDRECYVFQCHSDAVYNRDGLLYNPETGCCPRIYHGNGDGEAKVKLDQLYRSMDFAPTMYLKVNDIQVLDRDMLLVDFMSESMCKEMIGMANAHGGWNPMAGDKFPAREIRIRQFGLWGAMEEHWQKVLYPIIERHWKPMEMYGLRDAFVMRYSLDTQTNLRLHTDASLVTGSVKLNDDYLGADLIFPRQNITNRDIPVGKCILFPGQVTHGHECTELTYGTKYSLTMWSSRMKGDVN